MNLIKWIVSKAKFPRWVPAAKLNEKGQSIIIITFAFLGLIAMLGIALDVGLVYIERVRLKRTVDAAALAAVTELPSEEEAAVRAMNYLNANGYPLTSSNVYVAGCTRDIRNRLKYQADGTYVTDTTESRDLVNLPDKNKMAAQNLKANETYPLIPADYYPYVIYDTNNDGQYSLAVEGPAPSFFIDTRSFQDRTTPGVSELCDAGKMAGSTAGSYGGASKLKVTGQVPVRMNFMQFFGFETVTISDSATAENSSTLDVAVSLDTTGSMEFDTICYGCWARCGDTGTSTDIYSADYRYYVGNNAFLIPTSGTGSCSNTDRYKPYPENGRVFPFNYDGSTMQGLITGNNRLPRPVDWNSNGNFNDTDEDYIMLEAEFYSNNSSNWAPAFRSAGKGYWAVQRNWGAKGYAIDGYGYGGVGFSGYRLSGAVRHNPLVQNNGPNPFGHFYTQAEAQNGAAPRLEYEFYPTWTGSTYIYIRAQGMGSYYGGSPVGQFYWNVVDSAGADQTTVATATASSSPASNWTYYYGPMADAWSWVKLGPISLTPNPSQPYRLRVYAGQPGFGMDRILITKRNIDPNTSYLASREATPGSARGLASDPCNPIFGKSVLPSDCNPYGGGRIDVSQPLNNLDDSLFNALDPIRGAQESIRAFVARLDPKLDQAGFASFAPDAVQRSQLECLRASRARAAAGSQINNYPLNAATYGEYDELTCFDKDAAIAGTKPISFTNVFVAIEDVYPPKDGTDIADGMRRGLHLLGINTDNDDGGNHQNDCDWRRSGTPWWQVRRSNGTYLNQPGADSKSNPIISHCARGQAATGIIVLLTDGEPNNGDPGDNSECKVVPSPLPYEGFPTTANTTDTTRINNFNCVMYYTKIAADNGILIYTIGLGAGVDRDLLNAIADQTNAKAYFVLTASQLNAIFDQILSNTFVRLLQ